MIFFLILFAAYAVQYARKIVLAKTKKPTGMPTLIPILVETERLGEVDERLVLGLGIDAVDFAFEEGFAARGAVTDLVTVELFAGALFTAVLELGVVEGERVTDIMEMNIAAGIVVGLAASV